MVADAARVAHTGGGNDHFGVGVGVQGAGFLAAFGDVQPREAEQRPAPEVLDGLLVQVACQIAGEDFRGRSRQGGVHVDLEVRGAGDQPLLLDMADEVQKLLRAAHGKRGDHQISAPGQGFLNDLGQVGGIIGFLLHVVQAVAVGALGDHVVRLPDVLGRADDGGLAVAQVAGKDDLPGLALLGEPHLHAGGAQQVARVHEADLDAVGDGQLLAVLTGDDVPQGLFHVDQGVQRLHRGPAGPPALLILIGRVVLLDLGGVPQHDGQQLGRQTGTVDIAREPLLHQQGETAGVVDVGVGDHHVVDVMGGEIQLPVVPLVPALLEPAIYQYLVPVDLHAVTAARHRLGRAEECKFHLKSTSTLFDLLCSSYDRIVYHLEENVKKNPRNFQRSGLCFSMELCYNADIMTACALSRARSRGRSRFRGPGRAAIGCQAVD